MSGIDESLYSRQLYVMGHEAQQRMAVSSVLIVGLTGVGVEIAKNVILAGAKQVSLYDPKPAEFEDLSSQFFFTEADIGRSRADASVHKLAELNPYVRVDIVPDLSHGVISHFTVVVFVDLPFADRLDIADYCHAQGICVISTDVRGVFGQIFCDFGDNFLVHDSDDEPAASAMIAGIMYDPTTNIAMITCLEETRHNLENTHTVILSGIQGMEFLNHKQFSVSVRDQYTFEVYVECDSNVIGTYGGGGYVNQVKQHKCMHFTNMRESLTKPGTFVGDEMKLHRLGVWHEMFR